MQCLLWKCSCLISANIVPHPMDTSIQVFSVKSIKSAILWCILTSSSTVLIISTPVLLMAIWHLSTTYKGTFTDKTFPGLKLKIQTKEKVSHFIRKIICLLIKKKKVNLFFFICTILFRRTSHELVLQLCPQMWMQMKNVKWS